MSGLIFNLTYSSNKECVLNTFLNVYYEQQIFKESMIFIYGLKIIIREHRVLFCILHRLREITCLMKSSLSKGVVNGYAIILCVGV